MILTGSQIIEELNSNNIIISPFNIAQINPNSYDFRLGNSLKAYKNVVLDPKIRQDVNEIKIDKKGFTLDRNKFYLGSTFEKMGSNKFVPIIKGKSSLARLGLFIHITADLIDIGSINHWTLQLFAVQPIIVYPGMLIGQVTFWMVSGEITLYNGKYKDTIGPCESLSYLDNNN